MNVMKQYQITCRVEAIPFLQQPTLYQQILNILMARLCEFDLALLLINGIVTFWLFRITRNRSRQRLLNRLSPLQFWNNGIDFLIEL